MKKPPKSPRYKIHVDGEWQGGSFATAEEAEAVAKRLPGQKIEVLPKGGMTPPEQPRDEVPLAPVPVPVPTPTQPEPAPEPAAPEPAAPEQPPRDESRKFRK